MSIKIIDGDLFNTSAPVICHQVNCKGKMGSGVAKLIREKYPVAYESYRLLYNSEKNDTAKLLGHIQWCYCKDDQMENGVRTIINMFAQDRYGYNGKCYTDYRAFEYCLEQIKGVVLTNETIAMPYKIGCGLAGGDWNIIYGLIDRVLGQKYSVELWRKEG